MDAMPLKWDLLEYLPVALQDGASGEVMMIQYMTKEGFDRSLEGRSTWLSGVDHVISSGWPDGMVADTTYAIYAATVSATACSRSGRRPIDPCVTSGTGPVSRMGS